VGNTVVLCYCESAKLCFSIDTKVAGDYVVPDVTRNPGSHMFCALNPVLAMQDVSEHMRGPMLFKSN
jgi:hypothetical protein